MALLFSRIRSSASKIFSHNIVSRPKMTSKTLVAFDFDHTLIDDNSDIYLQKLAPNGIIPPEIEAQYSTKGWTKYMGTIFKYLHGKGITKSDILDCMREIQFTKGMPELLRHLGSAENNCESIIISDSNSVFIDCILRQNKLHDTVAEVFTNPAVFDKTDLLTIEFYHTQDSCNLSTINLCKGRILEDYVKKRQAEGVNFGTVYYIGDGENDLCPALRLGKSDFVCPRINFTLWKKIQKSKTSEDGKEARDIKANIVPWVDGWELLETIKLNSVSGREGQKEVN